MDLEHLKGDVSVCMPHLLIALILYMLCTKFGSGQSSDCPAFGSGQSGQSSDCPAQSSDLSFVQKFSDCPHSPQIAPNEVCKV